MISVTVKVELVSNSQSLSLSLSLSLTHTHTHTLTFSLDLLTMTNTAQDCPQAVANNAAYAAIPIVIFFVVIIIILAVIVGIYGLKKYNIIASFIPSKEQKVKSSGIEIGVTYKAVADEGNGDEANHDVEMTDNDSSEEGSISDSPQGTVNDSETELSNTPVPMKHEEDDGLDKIPLGNSDHGEVDDIGHSIDKNGAELPGITKHKEGSDPDKKEITITAEGSNDQETDDHEEGSSVKRNEEHKILSDVINDIGGKTNDVEANSGQESIADGAEHKGSGEEEKAEKKVDEMKVDENEEKDEEAEYKDVDCVNMTTKNGLSIESVYDKH